LGGVENSEDRKGGCLFLGVGYTTSIAYHGSEVIHIDGECYRIKEARETAEKKALVGGFQTPSAREHNAVAVAKTA
jgi:hypothetical protein